ncbi:MAG: exo-alpha-sialidase [Opitutales bacterium]|nr:exo-alpha-sialidase [Opitutales bacterium]
MSTDDTEDPAIPDWRHLARGRRLPFGGHYLDQPYAVTAADGAWVIVATCGSGPEGTPGQSVAVARSGDSGASWSDPVFLEPVDGPEASYAILLKTAFGRLYAFYNYNRDNIREVDADPEFYENGKCRRVDTQGYFVFRFSDDHGRTWSEERYEVPVRAFDIDLGNPYKGRIRFFWTVGRAFSHEGIGYLPLHKVGGFGDGFITRSEGVLIAAVNIHTERDPAKLRFNTLPEGTIGIRGVPGGGPIAEEHSFSVLSDGSFFVVFRTTDGHSACAYSRDQGRTWSPSRYMCYAGGRRFKHPRAATFAFRHSSGKYLCWFHNHGGRGYTDRRMVWLSVGREADGSDGKVLQWSEPEVLFYDDCLNQSFSYPDMLEFDGRTFFTISHKRFGTLHEVDASFLASVLSDKPVDGAIAANDIVFRADGNGIERKEAFEWPGVPAINHRSSWWEDIFTRDLRRGFSIEFAYRLDGALEKSVCLMDSRDDAGKGIGVRLRTDGSLSITLNDGLSESRWSSQPGLAGRAGLQHAVITVDGGPKIISFLVNGEFDDGGTFRQYGYGLFNQHFRSADNSSARVKFVRSHPRIRLELVRVYSRALLSAESRQCFDAIRQDSQTLA